MDKNTEQFQWTNELVMEFVNFHCEQKGIHWLSEDIEKFKQSKSKKEEPQWEILSFQAAGVGDFFTRDMDGDWSSSMASQKYTLQDLMDKMKPIHSVKRFPDNTVWSVDDDTQHGKITAFKITGNTMIAEIKNNVFPYDYPLYLSELKAPKEEQVPIKVESIAFYTSFGEKQIRDTFAVNLSNNISEDKLQSIKSAIEDELNGKTEHEKLLSKIEKKVKLANVINTHANYLRETLDLIKSLNK